MDKSKVKEILIKAREVCREERRFKGMRLSAAYSRLRRMAEGDKGGELYSSFYLVEEAYSRLRGKRLTAKLKYLTSAVFPLVTRDDLSEVISAFFETVADELDSDECESVKDAFLLHCILALANGRSECLELIRWVSVFDFTPFILGFVKYEEILRRDSVYVALDRESKNLYKEKIKKYSRKRGLTFSEGCERLWEEASAKGCHIGELLPFCRGSVGWLLVPIIIFSGLVAFSLYITDGEITPILSILLMPLLWQTAFELFVPIVARFTRSEILPRLDMSKIPESASVLTVITALGTNVSEVKRLFEHLEILSLKTRSRGRDEYAFWGVLLDLPESKEERVDKALIKAAEKEVDRLNAAHGRRFALFTRDREWDGADRVFRARERKRGAVIELVRYLRQKNSSIYSYGCSLPRVKYVLTLDADTDMELGALNRMVGTLEHPLNRPVVGERRGVKVVTRGVGILQPATVTDLEAVHKTAFSTLMGGSGGIDSYHSAIFNLNSKLFGVGIFCGKGMFDTEAFDMTVCDAFPDGRILSHDMLEGTRLRVGYMPDICFFESIPSSSVSYYNRAHRWARGDIQSLAFIGKRVETPLGKALNPMTASDRFVFVVNFVNLLVPVFQLLGLFFIMRYEAGSTGWISFLLLTPCFVSLFNELLRAKICGSVKNILRRFFGDTLTALYREVVMTGYRLSALAFEAYRNADAVIRTVWRMKVSKKRLLEWTTAGQSEGIKNGLVKKFLYTFPSFAAGIIMLSFASLSVCKLLGILWCLFFFIVFCLDKRAGERELSEHSKRLLTSYAKDMWGYFDKYANEENNHLPPDNVSVFPSSEVANRTSPTNIGLYLLSVLAALDFGFINLSSAFERLEKAVESIEKLPKYRGQLYNWYSTVTLRVIGQEYISTVDSGNFIACLVALYEGLGEYETQDKRVIGIRERIKKIERDTDFRFLFNSSRNLFSLGYFVDTEKQDGIMYDMFMSEARTTDYYAVARGIVKETHWQSLSRPIITSGGGVGMLSWSGTCFEYFMPHLLLPIFKNSFSFEALSYAFSEQVKCAETYRGERIYGISESGYYAFDESLGYQYRAFGVPSLSRRIEGERQRVISPYSSFLMLPIAPNSVIKNLESLKKVGTYGEFGFYEALDMTPSRVGNRPSVIKSFMSHHIGMSIVACANAVNRNIFVRRFMSDLEMKAVSELLREAVPADAVGVKKERMERHGDRHRPIRHEKREATFRTEASTWGLTGKETSAVLCERGLISLDVTRKGEIISAVRPVDSTNKCAMYIFGCLDGRVVSPSVSPDVSYSFDTAVVEYRQNRLRTSFSLSAKSCAARVRLEAQADAGEVGVYFEPLMTDFNSFASHPAFSNLFFASEYANGVLTLTRTGEKPFSLAVVSTSEYDFAVDKEELFKGVEYSLTALANRCDKLLSSSIEGILTSPCVFIKSKFKSKTDTTFVFGWGKTKSEAVMNAREELTMTEARSLKLGRELFYSALTASGGILERQLFSELLGVFRPSAGVEFKTELPEVCGMGGVYSLGISGKHPVFLVKHGVTGEVLEKIFRTHKLHYVMGLRYELIIEADGGGYYGGERAEAEKIAQLLQCAFMIGKAGGIHFADVGSVPKGLAVAIYHDDGRTERISYRNATEVSSIAEVKYDGAVVGDRPDVLWSYIIATPTFGTMVSHRGLGNTWVYNSRLSRITYWENSSVGGGFSEKVYMEKDGERYDLCAMAREVVYSCGSAEYIGRHYKIRVCVHPTLLFKAVSVTFEERDLTLLYKFLPILGDFHSNSCRVGYYRDSRNSVRFRNAFSDSLTKGFGYLMLPFENDIISDDGFGVHCERGGEVVFVLGYAGSERHYEAVREYFRSQRFSDFYLLYTNRMKELLKNEENFNIAYQTVVARFFARSGPYQSGGAWGFRDQAQDCLTMIDISPNTVRAHICRMASHQYREGDVQHWWHKGKGVRTRCSDDYLWLVWLVCMYVKRTNDKSVLGVKVAYLVSPTLGTGERDRYESPARTDEGFSILHHMISALDLFSSRGLGEHSLPLILGGDWNDGMNMLPDGSESVWLGFFARIVIHNYAELTGDDKYLGISEQIRQGIEENAFFSDRYARAFLPDGGVLGVEGSEYFEIDSLPQSFASICHAVTKDGIPSRITTALDTAWDKLYDGERKIFKLFTPPLSSFDNRIGYLSSYPEGVRENGGQYTHAAAWMGLACLCAPDKKIENRRRAELLVHIIDPKSHDSHVYKAEPYVLAGDVYTSGRGGWSWYTGSAAWYRELILRISDENRNNLPPLT